MSFEILRNATVEAVYGKICSKTGIPSLQIVINDSHHHTFATKSKESQMVFNYDLDTISKMFSGGTYVIYDGVLRDYRLGAYKGFIQSNDSIEKLAEKLGFEDYRLRKGVEGMINRVRSRNNNGLFMGGEWDKFSLDVKELGEGGAFVNKLVYQYSVFSPNIITSLETERLICTNGMVSSAAFASYEVPVISDWEENLNVITNRIKPEITELMRQRFIQMERQRANVKDMMDAHKTLSERLKFAQGDDSSRLEKLMGMTNAERNLARYYDEKVFKGSRSRFVEGNMTQFDLYNILTEASSHTNDMIGNDNAIQKLANRIVFDSSNNKVEIIPKVPKSMDSDCKRAFFGG